MTSAVMAGAGFHVAQVLTIWLPLALMAGFVWSTTKLRRTAHAELEQLAEQL